MTEQQANVEVVNRLVGYKRLDKGRRLREAMVARDLTITGLAEQTRLVDPAGVGVNWRQIGFLVSQGSSGRDTCSVTVGQLVAKALDIPVLLLFQARTHRVVIVSGVSAYRRIEVDTA